MLAHHAFSYARVPECALHWGVGLQTAVLIDALGTLHSFFPGPRVSVFKSLNINVIFVAHVYLNKKLIWGGFVL